MKCVVALVIISFVQILFVHNGQMFKGIKMCERDCELTKGCLGIYYDPVHLECRLLFDIEKSVTDTAPMVTKRIVKTKDALKMCSAKDRVVISGMGKQVCVPTKDTLQYSSSMQILFTQITPCASLSQLTFGREIPTVKTYPFIKPLHVLSMQYSSSLQKLFIVQKQPDNIFSIYIRKRKKFVIRNGRYCLLSVDGINGLIFALGDSQVYRMTTEGRLLRRAYRPPQWIAVRALTIDPQHELVYVVLYKYENRVYCVISLKYAGGDGHCLFEGTQGNIRYTVFDQTSHTLVYTQNNKIMSYDLSTKKRNQSVLTTVDGIRGITVYQGILFFVDGNSLMEFSYKQGKKTLVDLPENYLYQLCIIN